MIRSLLFGVFILVSLPAFCQKEAGQTTSFIVSGDVKSPVTITLNDLLKSPEMAIGDVIITNHLGEKKSEQKAIKGVRLKDILASVELNNESPKVLSEYYFACKATDGYLVVYSWNEIFNSPSGESVYLITSKNGVSAKDLEESILMISPKDYKTGRRYIKSLASIEVKRAQ